MNGQPSLNAFPSCDLRALLCSKVLASADPVLGSGRIRRYASGRAALYHIVKGLIPGSEILLPSFHCGVEVEAVLRADCRPRFYRIGKDLTVDLDQVMATVTPETQAVLVTHYFGFPQHMEQIQEFCRSQGLLLIEDCAHALYSRDADGNWLGTRGDYALFSMRKTSYLPNGGAVRVNRSNLAMPEAGRPYRSIRLLTGLVRSLLEYEACRTKSTARLALRLLEHHDKRPGTSPADSNSSQDEQRWYYDVAEFDYGHDISLLSQVCAIGARCDEIVSRRRHNYLQLFHLLGSAMSGRALFTSLPPGVCPLCLPLAVENRDEVVERMNRLGVHPFVFGRHPHQLLNLRHFPETADLSSNLLGLPVHQQLSEQHLQRVAASLQDALTNG